MKQHIVRVVLFMLLALMAFPSGLFATTTTHHSHKHRSSGYKNSPKSTKHPKKSGEYRDSHGVVRNKNGTIHRSSRARTDFKKEHPCPSTGKSTGACPGYVIDHIIALKHGGIDAPSNMQWQTVKAARAKDRWE